MIRNKRDKYIVLFSILIWGIIFISSKSFLSQSKSPLPGAEGDFKIRTKVVRVIDGDSFVIEPDLKNPLSASLKKKEELRAIGINAFEMTETDPQRLLFSRFQKDFAYFLLNNKHVFVEFAKTSDGQLKRDKYNRLLGYIFLDEVRMYQKIALREGKIKGYYAFPFKKKYEIAFKKAEAESREQKQGFLYNYPPPFIQKKDLTKNIGKVVALTFRVRKVVVERSNIYLESEPLGRRMFAVTVPRRYQNNFTRVNPPRYFRNLQTRRIKVRGFLSKNKNFLELRLYYPSQLW